MKHHNRSKRPLEHQFWISVALWLVSSVVSVASAGSVQGRVMLAESISLGVVESGVVAQVLVQRGQQVKKGQRLMVLDQRDFKARLSAAKARLVGLALDLGEAKREWERSQDLYERTVLSDHDLELARIAYRKLEEESKVAAANIRLRRIELERSEISSPFRALVVGINSFEGQPVRNDLTIQPLLHLVPLNRIRVTFTLPADVYLLMGQSVEVRFSGKTYTGYVDRLPERGGDSGPLWMIEISANLPNLGMLGSAVDISWE